MKLNSFWLFGLSILFVFMIALALAVKPVEEWNRTYGRPYGDGAWSLQRTGDGGYIIAGYTSSLGQSSDL